MLSLCDSLSPFQASAVQRRPAHRQPVSQAPDGYAHDMETPARGSRGTPSSTASSQGGRPPQRGVGAVRVRNSSSGPRSEDKRMGGGGQVASGQQRITKNKTYSLVGMRGVVDAQGGKCSSSVLIVLLGQLESSFCTDNLVHEDHNTLPYVKMKTTSTWLFSPLSSPSNSFFWTVRLQKAKESEHIAHEKRSKG